MVQHMRGSRGGAGVRIPPSRKSQSYRVPYQYWSGSHGKLKKKKLQRQHSMLGHHRPADDGPLSVVFRSSLPLST